MYIFICTIINYYILIFCIICQILIFHLIKSISGPGFMLKLKILQSKKSPDIEIYQDFYIELLFYLILQFFS